MKAFIHTAANIMQLLDTDKLWPVLEAASFPASKVFEPLAIIVINKKIKRHAYLQPN